MTDYIQILGIGIAIGLLDYLIKGVPKWDTLGDIFQGISWGLIISILYILAIVALACANMKLLLLVGILAVINEDFSYWIFRYIFMKVKFRKSRVVSIGWILKPPLNIPVWLYYSYLVLINVILIYLFVR